MKVFVAGATGAMGKLAVCPHGWSGEVRYRMLGSVAEAEDVVQEALLRVHRAVEAGERIDSPRAFVATITTRLAIDELRSARARRERYVGEWLPESILTVPGSRPRASSATSSPAGSSRRPRRAISPGSRRC